MYVLIESQSWPTECHRNHMSDQRDLQSDYVCIDWEPAMANGMSQKSHEWPEGSTIRLCMYWLRASHGQRNVTEITWVTRGIYNQTMYVLIESQPWPTECHRNHMSDQRDLQSDYVCIDWEPAMANGMSQKSHEWPEGSTIRLCMYWLRASHGQRNVTEITWVTRGIYNQTMYVLIESQPWPTECHRNHMSDQRDLQSDYVCIDWEPAMANGMSQKSHEWPEGSTIRLCMYWLRASHGQRNVTEITWVTRGIYNQTMYVLIESQPWPTECHRNHMSDQRDLQSDYVCIDWEPAMANGMSQKSHEWPEGSTITWVTRGIYNHMSDQRDLQSHEWPEGSTIRHEWPEGSTIRHEWPEGSTITWVTRGIYNHMSDQRDLQSDMSDQRDLQSHEWPEGSTITWVTRGIYNHMSDQRDLQSDMSDQRDLQSDMSDQRDLQSHEWPEGSTITWVTRGIYNHMSDQRDLQSDMSDQRDLQSHEWPEGSTIRHEWPEGSTITWVTRGIYNQTWVTRGIYNHMSDQRDLQSHEWPEGSTIRHEWPEGSTIRHEWPEGSTITWVTRGIYNQTWVTRGIYNQTVYPSFNLLGFLLTNVSRFLITTKKKLFFVEKRVIIRLFLVVRSNFLECTKLIRFVHP